MESSRSFLLNIHILGAAADCVHGNFALWSWARESGIIIISERLPPSCTFFNIACLYCLILSIFIHECGKHLYLV